VKGKVQWLNSVSAKSVLGVLICAGLILISSPKAISQTFYGSIIGTVSDATGAVVPGTNVTLTNLGTTEKRMMVTDNAGVYRFVNLLPGKYRVEAEKSGFKRFSREPVVVEVDSSPRIDVTLEVGEVTQTVEVSELTPLLQSQSSSLGQVVEARKVTEAPLNGRNPLALVALVPGVVPQGSKQDSSTGNPTGTNIFAWGNFQIGGGQANQSAAYLDGGSVHVNYLNLLALVPTQDAIQEFKVQTNNLGPEFGRFAGGVINLTTKSGSNSFHGTAYEFIRNKVLNANDFFNNASGVGRPPFTQNQFGGNAGGRIFKDKLFWFGSYEGFRQRLGRSYLLSVPTLAYRNGDFSDLRDSSGNLIPIYDPLTTCGRLGNPACARDAQGNEIITRQQFPGNIIPQDRLDPAAKILAGYWAPPNLPGQPFTHINNFATNASVGGNNDQLNTRVDYNLSDKQRIFGRYTYWTNLSLAIDPYKTGVCQDRCQESFNTHQFVFADTYTFSPTTILDVRLNYVRFHYDRAPTTLGTDLTTYGLPASLNNQVAWKHLPTVVPNDFDALWGTEGAGSGIFARNDNYGFMPSLTNIRGAHTLKGGWETRILRHNYAQSNIPSGRYNFNNLITSTNPFNPGSSGSGFASFMLGYGNDGNIVTPSFTSSQQIYNAVYFGDTFQVSRKLTLNLGMRWDLQGPWSERYDRIDVLLPTADNPLAGPTGLPLKGRLGLVNSADRSSRNPVDMSKKMFNPRFGFAYQLRDKTVVRGGYGLFWLPSDVMWNTAPNNNIINTISTPWVATIDGGLTPYNVLSNPFPTGVIQPPGRDPSFQQILLGQGINAAVTNALYAYAQQWNLDIQHELPDGTLFDIAYAGSKGVHLPAHTQNLNQLPDEALSLGSTLQDQVANPFYGLISSGTLAAPTVARGQLLRPFPQYTGVAIDENTNRNSTYHSLQAKVEKRLRGGGTILASYTVAKLISDTDTLTGWLETASGTQWGDANSNNIRYERSLTAYDVPQRFVLSYVLDLPFGKGQKFAKDKGGVGGKLISGWGINGITTLQSGFPLGLGADNLSNSFGGSSRPVSTGKSGKLTGSATGRLNEWFDTSAYTPPVPFTFGNLSRTLPDVRTQGINNWDIAIFKNTKFGPEERFGIQFRTEFFNTFNRTQFGYPNTSCCRPDQGGSNNSFGVVSSTANLPRLVQFALRFTF
jgi:hypothetical protein